MAAGLRGVFIATSSSSPPQRAAVLTSLSAAPRILCELRKSNVTVQCLQGESRLSIVSLLWWVAAECKDKPWRPACSGERGGELHCLHFWQPTQNIVAQYFLVRLHPDTFSWLHVVRGVLMKISWRARGGWGGRGGASTWLYWLPPAPPPGRSPVYFGLIIHTESPQPDLWDHYWGRNTALGWLRLKH